MEKVSRGEIVREKTRRGLQDGLTYNFISLDPEYKQTMANSKLESLQSKTCWEVCFCGAEDLGTLCCMNAPTETLTTTSLWMNSLGNVPQTPGPVNDSIPGGPGSMISFGLAEHQQLLLCPKPAHGGRQGPVLLLDANSWHLSLGGERIGSCSHLSSTRFLLCL